MDHGQVATQELIAGRYRTLEAVHREEGRTVWTGEDVEFGRPVTLTESRLAPLMPQASLRRTITRMLRESQTMQLLCPGRVVAVLDVVDDNGVLWTVTEPIEGTPLGELLNRGPLNHVRAARIGLGILHVVEAGHRQGVTHGDLSPGQVFVRDGGDVAVTGFGLIGTSVTQRVTALSYASPEQARGSSAGPAADQWALGALLYAMVEGRPPTLRAVDRLPLRPPLHAGPLGPAITGLLRQDALERVPEPVVRASLTRIVSVDPDEPTQEMLRPRFRGAWLVTHRAGRAGSRPAVRRSVLVGAVLVIAASSVAALVAVSRPGGAFATGTEPSGLRAPSLPGAASGAGTSGTSVTPPGSSTPAPSTSQSAPSSGTTSENPVVTFHRYVAPEGFSIDLPQGWRRINTYRAGEGTYRITFGASRDPRTLIITYSVQRGLDPVAVWRDLEPSLESTYAGYERVGDIRAVTYQGHKGAGMQWLSTVNGVRIRTFGLGFLLGDGLGCSLRWTTLADDPDSTANQQALNTFVRTFRPPAG